MLKLRRGTVVSVERDGAREGIARLSVELEQGGAARSALAYPELTGSVEAGDDVVVNVEARELGLGSGGFDIVCLNLTRPSEDGEQGANVMKLNYTPIQHAVSPLEEGLEEVPAGLGLPVAVLAVHGQLGCAAFALSARAPDARVGYVQTEGGALAGRLSDTVASLLERGLICDHATVAPCFGGGREAITLEGALDAGARRLGWDAALVGPGPGILGSASALGHGGLAALHSAHSALSLGSDVTLAARVSSGDERPRHRGLSHHTKTVLALLLRAVDVAVPEEMSAEVRAELDRSLEGRVANRPVTISVEDLVAPYLESGLPASTMGRSFDEDQDFFKAALAAGAALAGKAGGDPG